MSQHNVTHGETPQITVDKPLCFLLDEKKNKDDVPKKGRKGKKKEASNQPTFKNFGNRVNVGKIKQASKLIIGWRIRPGGLLSVYIPLKKSVCSDGGWRFHKCTRLETNVGIKLIIPIRPICCLAGGLDMDSSIVRLM